jgi:hypothetical protein
MRDTSEEFLRYFRYRKAWEAKKYGLFPDEEIEWLNEATHRWKGERFESLYFSWLSGLTVEAVQQEFAKVEPQKDIQFATYLVRNGHLADRFERNGVKCTSGPCFRQDQPSLQARHEAKLEKDKEITRDEKARRNAAKLGWGSKASTQSKKRKVSWQP